MQISCRFHVSLVDFDTLVLLLPLFFPYFLFSFLTSFTGAAHGYLNPKLIFLQCAFKCDFTVWSFCVFFI